MKETNKRKDGSGGMRLQAPARPIATSDLFRAQRDGGILPCDICKNLISIVFGSRFGRAGDHR